MKLWLDVSLLLEAQNVLWRQRLDTAYACSIRICTHHRGSLDGGFGALILKSESPKSPSSPSVFWTAGRHLNIAWMSEVSPVYFRLLKSRQVSDYNAGI